MQNSELQELVVIETVDTKSIASSMVKFLAPHMIVYPFASVSSVWKQIAQEELTSRYATFEDNEIAREYLNSCDTRDLYFFLHCNMFCRDRFPMEHFAESNSDDIWKQTWAFTSDNQNYFASIHLHKDNTINFVLSVEAKDLEAASFSVNYSNKSKGRYFVNGKELVSQSQDTSHTSRKQRVSKHVGDVNGMTEYDMDLVKEGNQLVCASPTQSIYTKPHLRMMINNVDIFCYFASSDFIGNDKSTKPTWYQYNNESDLNYNITKNTVEQLKYMKDPLFLDRYVNRCFDELKCLTKAAVMRLPIYNHLVHQKQVYGSLLPMIQRKEIMNQLLEQTENRRKSILHSNITKEENEYTTSNWIHKFLMDYDVLEFVKRIIVPHWYINSLHCVDQQVYFKEQDEPADKRYGNCNDSEFIKYHFEKQHPTSIQHQEDDSSCMLM